MDTNMDLQTYLAPEQSLRVSPTLIMVNSLLAVSSLELQQMVHNEIEQNPALESVEASVCTHCGAGTTGRFCTVCSQPVYAGALAVGADRPARADDDFDFDDVRTFRDGVRATRSAMDDDFDPLTLVASRDNLYDDLLADLLASMPETDHPIARYLIGSLDEQGFLKCSVESAARALDVSVERVETALDILQSTGPVGVGARDLCECLLLQLRELEAEGVPDGVPPHVESIIRNHLRELGEHKYTAIAHALDCTHDDVVVVHDFIKAHLQPRPLIDAPQARTWSSPSTTNFVLPDVVIREREGKLEAEVVEKYRFSLRMNPIYQQLASDNKSADAAPASNGSNGAGAAPSMSQGDREHIRHYVNQAKLFISSINQRHETLLRVTNCLIELQEEFIRFGVRYLQPLTRAQVAQYLGLHESTISRATADKYLMLPDKRVIPFSDFFSASLSIKDVIKELVTKEARPMTDNEIVVRLQEQGIRIARRTVAKYRTQLGIMPSTLR
jgi:RNA polymerase sigma-54 factor